ncbi:histidinol phosphate phosphatase [candidate division KSB1 bacterium]|nr:histidinol phosphate phosphatase [candidate division KSB1 bacterium]
MRELFDFAVETVYEAGRLTLGYFRAGTRTDFKPDDTPVTIADREAEALIRARIEKQFPDHAIVGEEFGVGGAERSDYRWIIDPIDGTKSFVRGVPLYGVLIGLEIEGRIEVGAVYFPALDEMVAAASGLGCTWNGRPARVIDTPNLARGMVAFTDAASFEVCGRGAEWKRIQQATYYRMGCSDAYGHALVATGRVELMLDPEMSSWDCGPFPVILREAGGYFGDWSGRETIEGGEAMSTTRTLLPQVLELIRG